VDYKCPLKAVGTSIFFSVLDYQCKFKLRGTTDGGVGHHWWECHVWS